MHEFDVFLAVHLAEIHPFLEANAVLAGDRSTEANAQTNDLAGQLFSFVKSPFLDRRT